MSSIHEKNAAVITPNGPGVIKYVRMKAPDFCEPEAYSVYVFNSAHREGYTGTMFNADLVKADTKSERAETRRLHR